MSVPAIAQAAQLTLECLNNTIDGTPEEKMGAILETIEAAQFELMYANEEEAVALHREIQVMEIVAVLFRAQVGPVRDNRCGAGAA